MSVPVPVHNDPRCCIVESPSLTPEQRRRLRELAAALRRERQYNADKSNFKNNS